MSGYFLQLKMGSYVQGTVFPRTFCPGGILSMQDLDNDL